jgi:hypothetical protein
MKNPRHNLIESIFVSEVLLKDVKCNNRNMYLPEFIENFRKSETGKRFVKKKACEINTGYILRFHMPQMRPEIHYSVYP